MENGLVDRRPSREEPAPPRDEWVAAWPEFLWSPSTGDLPLDPERQAAIDEACPWPDADAGS